MGETIPPATSPKKPAWADHLKNWGEAASATFKAALHFVFLCLVLAAAGILLWREATTHALHVDVGREVQAALTLHGGDIDLGPALQDALNDRLQGVRRIVEVKGWKIVGSEDEAQSVSFKPFGVDVTTDEITRLTDLILNRPKPPTVRMELLCEGGPCTDAGSHPVSLVMAFLGPDGQRRSAYPLARGTAALRRTLRQAIQNTADVVLEQSEPGIASIWFLNRGTIASIDQDQYQDDLSRAVGAAVQARRDETASDCIADVVIGMSLLARNAYQQGVAVERQAAAKHGTTCQIHLLTNIVIGLQGPAYCFGSADTKAVAAREIAAALTSLRDLQGGPGPDIVMLRIPAIQYYIHLLDLLKNAGGDALQNLCNASPASPHGPPSTLAAQIAQVLDGARKALPEHPTGDPMHAIVAAFWSAMRAGIHSDDFGGRVKLDRKLLDMIHAYQAADPAPRQLDMLEGQVETDIGNAVIDALQDGPAQQAELAGWLGAAPSDSPARKAELLDEAFGDSRNEAIIAFENGQATHAVPLTDPPDIDMLGMLGDARLLFGQGGGAQAAYANAVDAFIDANEPVEQLPALADIFARWASQRIMAGACLPGAPPDDAWQDRWSRLGFAAPDICSLQHNAASPANVEAANLPRLAALMHGEMTRCPGPGGPSELKPLSVLALAAARMHFVACHDGTQAKRRFIALGQSARSLDAELTQALVSHP